MTRNSARDKKLNHKKNTRKSKKNIYLKKVILTGIVFVISLLFLFGYFFYMKITTQLASAFGSYSRDFVSENITTVAVLEVDDIYSDSPFVNDVNIYLFDKDTSKLVIYEIASNTKFDMPDRYGVEPFHNVLACGKMDNPEISYSGEFATRALMRLLAFPIDRYLIVSSSTLSMIESFLKGSLSFDLSNATYEQFKNNIKTNLSINELIDTYKFSKSLPDDRIIEKSLTEDYLLSQSLDEELMDLTFDLSLSKENKGISVLNGTSISGVANFGARVLKNYGGRVLATANTSEEYESSVIIADDINTESVRIISKIFNINKVVMKNQVSDYKENEIDRSDITVIFGLDFAKTL